MIIDLLPTRPDSYLKNCLIRGKSGGGQAGMFVGQDGVILARLDGYAIVPRNEYEEMIRKLDEYEHNVIPALELAALLNL